MDWIAAKPLLDAKLDPANVRKPEGRHGPKGDWIEGWHAIAEANRIFGHGAWSYEIKSLNRDALDEGTDRNGNVQFTAAYTAIVRLDVAGTVREDVGYGSGYAKQPGDAIEGATKEAVTDALKRTLRTFGWPFGLALYDKQREHVGVTPQPRDPKEIAESLIGVVKKATTEEELNKALGGAKFDAAWQWLAEEHENESHRVREAVDAARQRVSEPTAAEYLGTG